MPAWVRTVTFGLPPIVLLVLVILVAMPYCATCGGHDEEVTTLIHRCKPAIDRLGADAHPARIGVACGGTEVSGGNGTASWTLPYTGSKDRGTVSFDAVKRGGVWTVDRASLDVGDDTIDLVACGAPALAKPAVPRGVQTNADDLRAELAGKILRSTHPTLAVGQECKGTLVRERGSPTAEARVSCGDSSIYSARGSFKLEVGDPSHSNDDRIDYSDDIGHCRISIADGKGTLTVWSTAPAWELVVDL